MDWIFIVVIFFVGSLSYRQIKKYLYREKVKSCYKAAIYGLELSCNQLDGYVDNYMIKMQKKEPENRNELIYYHGWHAGLINCSRNLIGKPLIIMTHNIDLYTFLMEINVLNDIHIIDNKINMVGLKLDPLIKNISIF